MKIKENIRIGNKKYINLIISNLLSFSFFYYNDPSKPMNGRWNGFNLKGMLTYEREIKLPFYALKEAYSHDKQR